MKTQPKPLDQITREDFAKYERVRRHGAYNMITQWQDAAFAADLPEDTYRGICTHYAALMEKYPDVRE